MKNQTVLIFVLSLLFGNYCFSQISSSVVAKDITIVKVSVENLVYMLNSTTATWESEIKSLGLGYREIQNGGVQYSCGNTIAGGIEIVLKAPDFVNIQWLHSMNNITIMDELQNSIEKNFLGRDGQYLVYGFNFKGQDYTIQLLREQHSEMLFIRKHKK